MMSEQRASLRGLTGVAVGIAKAGASTGSPNKKKRKENDGESKLVRDIFHHRPPLKCPWNEGWVDKEEHERSTEQAAEEEACLESEGAACKLPPRTKKQKKSNKKGAGKPRTSIVTPLDSKPTSRVPSRAASRHASRRPSGAPPKVPDSPKVTEKSTVENENEEEGSEVAEKSPRSASGSVDEAAVSAEGSRAGDDEAANSSGEGQGEGEGEGNANERGNKEGKNSRRKVRMRRRKSTMYGPGSPSLHPVSIEEVIVWEKDLGDINRLQIREEERLSGMLMHSPPKKVDRKTTTGELEVEVTDGAAAAASFVNSMWSARVKHRNESQRSIGRSAKSQGTPEVGSKGTVSSEGNGRDEASGLDSFENSLFTLDIDGYARSRRESKMLFDDMKKHPAVIDEEGKARPNWTQQALLSYLMLAEPDEPMEKLAERIRSVVPPIFNQTAYSLPKLERKMDHEISEPVSLPPPMQLGFLIALFPDKDPEEIKKHVSQWEVPEYYYSKFGFDIKKNDNIEELSKAVSSFERQHWFTGPLSQLKTSDDAVKMLEMASERRKMLNDLEKNRITPVMLQNSEVLPPLKKSLLKKSPYLVASDKIPTARLPPHLRQRRPHNLDSKGTKKFYNIVKANRYFWHPEKRPVILSVMPEYGDPRGGTTVLLTGHYFASAMNVKVDPIVYFTPLSSYNLEGEDAMPIDDDQPYLRPKCVESEKVSVIDDHSILCVSPPCLAPGRHFVQVEVDGLVSEKARRASFVFDNPWVTEVTPRQCGPSGGVKVVVNGNFFGEEVSKIRVEVSGYPATDVKLKKKCKQLTCVLPAAMPGHHELTVYVTNERLGKLKSYIHASDRRRGLIWYDEKFEVEEVDIQRRMKFDESEAIDLEIDFADLIRKSKMPEMDMVNVLVAFNENLPMLRRVFYYYAIESAQSGVNCPNDMTSRQWRMFCEECKIVGDQQIGQTKVPIQVMDIVFIRSNKEWEDDDENDDNSLNFNEFCGAVLRIAHQKFPSLPINRRLETIISDHILPFGQQMEDQTAFLCAFTTVEMEDVINEFTDFLEDVFYQFAADDASGGIKGNNTLNWKETTHMLQRLGIIGEDAEDFNLREYQRHFYFANMGFWGRQGADCQCEGYCTCTVKREGYMSPNIRMLDVEKYKNQQGNDKNQPKKKPVRPGLCNLEEMEYDSFLEFMARVALTGHRLSAEDWTDVHVMKPLLPKLCNTLFQDSYDNFIS